jgi:phage recombination protein Bet
MSNLVAHSSGELSADQMNLIKATVAKGATDDELKLFLYRCKHMGLDPLKPGQIHFVKYGNSPGTIIVGIDGFRARAAATGKHAGTKRGVLRDDKGKCIGAFCEVYRSDWKECAREEVSLSEYNTGKAQWAKMPETMIKKVAEAAALRMAFPDELGGVYSDDEMAQAESGQEKLPQEKIANPLKPPQDPGDYVIPVGQFEGQKIRDVDMFKLDQYVRWIVKSSQERSKEPTGHYKDIVDNAEAYLSSIEVDSAKDAMGSGK